MVQIAMGMMGFIVVHPRNAGFMRVDRDFVFLLAMYDIEPGSYTPKVSTMLDFNLSTFNSRAFPGIDHLAIRKGDRVRVRIGNLTMTNHPIHIHGHDFEVTCTDGGWVREGARWPEATVDVAVGQMRAFEFVADNPGDWALHCHKAHHVMNAMGHNVPTMIGVDQRDLVGKINRLVPEYMAMGEKGGSMDHEMPIPENTLPMMAGDGPFGPMEMGGMFTVVKIRDGLARDDYRDPGWYKHPPGTQAYEWTGAPPPAASAPAAAEKSGGRTVNVRKGASGHEH
jgi:manganese oxidase